MIRTRRATSAIASWCSAPTIAMSVSALWGRPTVVLYPSPPWRDGESFRDRVAVVRRRFWVILVTIALGTGATLWLSLQQEKLFQASAGVLLNQQSSLSSITGLPDQTAKDPERAVQTQVA